MTNQEILEHLLFGGTSNTANGGLMLACGLDRSHIADENDAGERPAYPFLTFWEGSESRSLYGPRQEQPIEVREILPAVPPGTEADDCILSYRNATELQARLYFYGLRPDQTPAQVMVLVDAAIGYLKTKASEDLRNAGTGAIVIDPGEVRDASTVLNDELEIRYAIDVVLRRDRDYERRTGAIRTISIEVGAPDEHEKVEVSL